jgi:hypothetical protein
MSRQPFLRSQPKFPLAVSPDAHHLVDANLEPFYYVADTHWPLLWHYTIEEASEVILDRSVLGFTAVQISIFPFDGVPNANGDHIFFNRTTLTPNPLFFDHCDAVLDMLEPFGFAVYIVVLWWNQVMSIVRQESPDICRSFGHWLGARWRHRRNLLWVLGGDTPWLDTDMPFFRAMAEGLRSANATQLISFHPQTEHSSSEHLGLEPWMDFHSVQIHADDNWSNQCNRRCPTCGCNLIAETAATDLDLGKPSLVAETNYYWKHPCEWVYTLRFCIHADAHSIRSAHWIARLGGGSFGEGYGAFPFWTGLAPSRMWRPELRNQPAARQIAQTMQGILRRFPWHRLRPDRFESVVKRSTEAWGPNFTPAAMTDDGKCALVYFLSQWDDFSVVVDLTWFRNAVEVIWYSAVTGEAWEQRVLPNTDKAALFDPEEVEGLEDDDLVLTLQALPDPPSPPAQPPSPNPPSYPATTPSPCPLQPPPSMLSAPVPPLPPLMLPQQGLSASHLGIASLVLGLFILAGWCLYSRRYSMTILNVGIRRAGRHNRLVDETLGKAAARAPEQAMVEAHNEAVVDCFEEKKESEIELVPVGLVE